MENLKHTPGPWEADTDLMHPIITGPDGANHGPMVGGEDSDFIIAKFFGPDANANARLCVEAVEMLRLLEKALTLQEPIYQAFTVSNETSLIFSGIRALLARFAAPALLLFALSLPASAQVQSGFEIEYMLSATDATGQIRFDTLRGIGPVQIADLLENGAEITDTDSTDYDVFLYSKAVGLFAQTTYPTVTALKIPATGYYRLEVIDRENQIDRISQFYYKALPGGRWRIIYVATVK